MWGLLGEEVGVVEAHSSLEPSPGIGISIA